MPLRRYLPGLAAGSVLWGFLYATAGFAGVAAWWQLYLRSPGAAIVLLVLLVLLAGGVAAYVLRQVRARRTERETVGAR